MKFNCHISPTLAHGAYLRIPAEITTQLHWINGCVRAQFAGHVAAEYVQHTECFHRLGNAFCAPVSYIDLLFWCFHNLTMDFGGGYGRGRGGGPPLGRGRGGGRGYRERSFSPPPQRRSPDYGRYNNVGYGRGGARFGRRDGDYRCGPVIVFAPFSIPYPFDLKIEVRTA